MIWIVSYSIRITEQIRFSTCTKAKRYRFSQSPPGRAFRKIPEVFSSISLCLNALICIVTTQALRSHTMANPYTYADQRQWSEIWHGRRGNRRDGEFYVLSRSEHRRKRRRYIQCETICYNSPRATLGQDFFSKVRNLYMTVSSAGLLW